MSDEETPMPAALPLVTVGDVRDGVLVTAAVLGALTVIIGTVVRVWQLQRAMIVRQHENAEMLAEVKAQVLPNHSTSMRDAVDRVESTLAQHILDERAARRATHDRIDRLLEHLSQTHRHDEKG